MTRALTWLCSGLAILAIVLGLTSSWWLVPALHDRTLAQFSSELFRVPLPGGTIKNAEISKVGQQIGNGDHCDYLAAVMLSTDMEKGAAEDYFKSKYSNPTKLQFLWSDDMAHYASQENIPYAVHTLSDWISGRKSDDKTNLVVYVFEASMTSAWDHRCQ